MNILTRCFKALLPALLLAASPLTASEYLVGTPRVPLAVEADGAAALTVAPQFGGFLPTDAPKPTMPRVGEQVSYNIDDVLAAAPIDVSNPQYWLGDELLPPEGTIDWDAMREAVQGDRAGFEKTYIVDPGTGKVYAVAGGSVKVPWQIRKPGSSETVMQEVTYQVSPIASGRPKRLYWTNVPFNAPPVSMFGKYVRIFGAPKTVYRTEDSTRPENERSIGEVEHGVFLDLSSMTLHAIQGDLKKHGQLVGQMVVAYYDSGLYNRLLGLVPVELTAPNPIDMFADIGLPIRPNGGGHDVTGLKAYPMTPQPADNRGDYYYVHNGTNSYSPHDGDVFPLRPTDASVSTALQVWWKEFDNFNTLWPFEFCNYTCRWGSNTVTYVRGPVGASDSGRPMRFDETLSPKLEKFQTPEGHAIAPAAGDATFRTRMLNDTEPHYALLRFSLGEDICFLPVRSVSCDDPTLFDGSKAEWAVGTEVVPRTGSSIGTVGGYRPMITPGVGGYIYPPNSGIHYNPKLYRADGDRPSEDPEALRSAIFPVNAGQGGTSDLQVWWSSTADRTPLEDLITFPSLVQTYTVRWPTAQEGPQIVLASQLGSAMDCLFVGGKALHLESVRSSFPLPAVKAFRNGEGTVGFWVRGYGALTDGRLLTLRSSKSNTASLTFSSAADGSLRVSMLGETLTSDIGLLRDDRWHYIAFTFSDAGARLSVDNTVKTFAPETLPKDRSALSGLLDVCCIGADGNSLTCAGIDVDGLTVRWRAMPEIVDNEALREAVRDPSALSLAMSFDERDSLVPQPGADTASAYESVSGRRMTASGVRATLPGAPLLGNGVIHPDRDTVPTVYWQDDSKAPGYNPNEEHALVLAGSDGYVTWAIRNDLNTMGTSPSGVLVSYVKDGEPRMQWFPVTRYNERYPEFRGTVVAGTQVKGPHPLDFLVGSDNKKNTWDATSEAPFRDRKDRMWAVCEDKEGFNTYLYYPLQEGFWMPPSVTLPKADDNDRVLIPWLAGYDSAATGSPTPWRWCVRWPEKVPELKIGQTLTTAVNGLPEVWNARSMAVVYPWADTEGDTDALPAYLIDPTVRQTQGVSEDYGTVDKFLKKLGVDISDKGNALYRNGVYTFRDLPPSISARFFIDPNMPIDKALSFIGEKEDVKAGTPLLWVNVMTADERKALKDIMKRFALSGKDLEDWEDTIDLLAKEPVQPSVQSGHRGVVEYSPADHYALVANGKDGYVTLIENDSRSAPVQEGDPISMHVIRVVPELYVAPLAVRTDPLNLLSQQLTVVYGESFAGRVNDFDFEWRYTYPTASGRIPADVDNDGYLHRLTKAGLYSLQIGGEGDSLENMVNTYHAVRYRPRPDTKAYDCIRRAVANPGEDYTAIRPDDPRLWSEWSGPTLSEGWVQRVLNNITPFTQQMADLYSNPAETAVSMIQKAGGPYMGDVALNQDNLPNVGLIQLYLTLLSRAEALSFATDKPGTKGVNDQLLLAATRAADLYSVLGDEAYADAMNPTVGFGMNVTFDKAPPLGLDYGALSGSLFCFDNQVPTLLDEELALLRGRGTDSNRTDGSLQVSPYFNRLPWNFTRGITAGEVAYAVNYNITGKNSATVDVEEAAALYPQGHGDAYGHYLSALKLYYRLLRNPNFSWGTPGMGEMLLGDAVTNVDYYEENRFAEIAARMAETARETVERTARKCWAENGGIPGGGYADGTDRGFGYGEWAVKSGLGCLYNWAAANALLPEAPDPEHYYQAEFDGTKPVSGIFTTLPESCAVSHNLGSAMAPVYEPFTFEFQVSAAPVQPGTGVLLAALHTGDTLLRLNLGADRALRLQLVRNGETTFDEALVALPPDERVLVALGREEAGSPLRLRILKPEGESLDDRILDINPDIAGGELSLATGLNGSVHEVRWWQGLWRTTPQLKADFAVVKTPADGLLAYLRTFTSQQAPDFLDDETDNHGADWMVSGAVWTPYAKTGFGLAFADDGLSRIDRSTASSLGTLASVMTSVTEQLDRLDNGTNPLGFAADAVPCDISPKGMDDGTSSHFEQMAERADKAVRNAAAVLDHVQDLGSRLRQIEESRISYDEHLDREEFEYNAQLIGYYGSPLADDIGPGGTYAQGYAGPDLYHYMYMDLAAYGLKDEQKTSTFSTTYRLTDFPSFSNPAAGRFAVDRAGETVTFTYDLTDCGLVAKPDHLKGTRRTYGSLQQAYADIAVRLIDVREAVYLVERKEGGVTAALNNVKEIYSRDRGVVITAETLTALKTGINSSLTIAKLVSQTLTGVKNTTIEGSKVPIKAADIWTVIGTSFGTNAAGSAVQMAYELSQLPLVFTTEQTNVGFRNTEASLNLILGDAEAALGLYGKYFELVSHVKGYKGEILGAIENYTAAVSALHEKIALLQSAIERFTALKTEAEDIQERRAQLRSRAVNAMSRMRYNDMFFRKLRSEAVRKYEQAFAIAQRYVYIAAQAYGYEAVADMTDLRAEIVKARTVGTPGSAASAGGSLADILERMKTDWVAVKPRLGINNPQRNVTWFSLRRELMRILPGADGDKAWQEALSKYRVDDLRKVPEFRRHCLSSFADKETPEPGLVIPFPTTVMFAENFFGRELGGDDAGFDGSYFATRIAGAGIRLKDYPAGRGGLSRTPTAWLLPVGHEYFRRPGGDELDVTTVRITDQVIPLPYNVGKTELNSPDWQPLFDGDFGGADRALRIRRHPSFRVTYGHDEPTAGDASALTATRLIGRSVWNDRWVLIIPFGSMNSNRGSAADAFICGKDGVPGVSDIYLGLRTYSHAGN